MVMGIIIMIKMMMMMLITKQNKKNKNRIKPRRDAYIAIYTSCLKCINKIVKQFQSLIMSESA